VNFGGGAGGGTCTLPGPIGGSAGTNGGTAGGSGTAGAGGSSSGGNFGGGGGGGGYIGGGAGGSSGLPGSGGGGGAGSSFGPAGSVVATATAAPSVTMGPSPPTLAVGAPGSLAFPGTQPLETVSAPQTLNLTNIGSVTLAISGLAFAGTDPGDFFVGSDGCLGPLAPGAGCSLTVNFAPQATGSRSATLQIASNDPNSPTSVGLMGTGGQLPQGPPGPNGTNGAPGAQGPTGKVELVTCRTVTKTVKKKVRGKTRKVKVTKRVCTTKLVSGPVKFTTSAASYRATLSRGRETYATGTAAAAGPGLWKLALSDRRAVHAGRYTLTLSRGRVTRRLTITIT
jgi:hypothetical protein